MLYNLQKAFFMVRFNWRKNMKKTFKFLVFLIVSFMMVGTVQAKTVNGFYGKIDDNVKMKDEVNGSTFLAGSKTEMTGQADGISFMTSDNVNFKGTSEFIGLAGNTVDISGTVYKDSFVAGNVVTVDKEADLQRDAFIAGSEVEINGNIGRNVTIYASKVTFKGSEIKGNVSIYASSISADDKTKIDGNLSYPEDADVNIADDIVGGKITKTEAAEDSSNGFVTTVMGKFWSFMALMLVFAVLSLAAPKLFTRMQKVYDKFDFNKGLEVFTKGLVFMILVPVIIFILFLMSIGIPLALILLALYFIIMYLSTVFTGYLIGYKLWQKFFNNDINMLVVGIFGLAILFVLNLIPGISVIVSILTVFIGTGIIYDVILKKLGSSD